jgi:hypothetical protein
MTRVHQTGNELMHPQRATRLPGSLVELGGLRAARWVRESTRGQFDTYGPEAQREQQDAPTRAERSVLRISFTK